MSRYILAVDDDQESIRLSAVTLRPLGIPVVAAADGDEALAQVAHERPALILLDLMMPRLSGYRVLSSLSDDPRTADIPIIIITAYARDHDEMALPGVVRVLSKGSFGVGELRRIVRMALVA